MCGRDASVCAISGASTENVLQIKRPFSPCMDTFESPYIDLAGTQACGRQQASSFERNYFSHYKPYRLTSLAQYAHINSRKRTPGKHRLKRNLRRWRS